MEDEESKSKMQAGESGFRHCRPATGERERERERGRMSTGETEKERFRVGTFSESTEAWVET